MSAREASHAGSWYSSNKKELNSQLTGWLAKAGTETTQGDALPIQGLRAVIAPHAGYSYSGPAAGYAYKCINPDDFKRVFILGPSHHVYLSGCALSKCESYETPLGDLIVDRTTTETLAQTGKFDQMSQEMDEDEHSLEMHLPYIYKVFEKKTIQVVPIVVGALNETTERLYGKLLAPYLDDPENLFVVSSDFCHWGTRFDYTYYTDEYGAVTQSLARSGGKKNYKPPSESGRKIFESIRELDHEGMEKIEQRDHGAFCKYLSQTKNTVCGRHPIGVLLAAVAQLDRQRPTHRIQFVHYAQSSGVVTTSDSSVSYASAFVQRSGAGALAATEQ
ncbi:hypothetical protein BGZ83_005261 [Gryganskiella cystojenkinii]|nr:hypothetical protein BGZ83_005261 [Gryganskiella cystojenkinii]